jgi:isocitrate/isopropylmalate dehydrogenase
MRGNLHLRTTTRRRGHAASVIPGDGIGPEVINEALEVLGEIALDVETTEYNLGAAR